MIQNFQLEELNQNKPTIPTFLKMLCLRAAENLVLLFLLIGVVGFAQPVAQKMSLQQVTDLALNNAQSIKVSQLQEKYHDIMQRTSGELPKTQFSTELGNYNSGFFDSKIAVSQSFAAGSLYKKQKTAQLITFARCEALDLNASIPAPPKAIYDGTEKQRHIIAGFSYLPIPNVVIKADVRLLHTGPQNSNLVINPAPNALPYRQSNQFLNIGIGYSF